MRELSPLFQRAIVMIRAIPQGKVATYAKVAELVAAPGCARHISYILSSSSRKYGLPWHRVVNSKGRISLPTHGGYFKQKARLEREKIAFVNESIDLNTYLWRPTRSEVRRLLRGLPEHVPLALR